MTDFKTYLFSYNYEGASWSFEIKAASPQDAQDRVKRLAYAIYDGEEIARIPASLGWFVRIIVPLRNWLFGAKP